MAKFRAGAYISILREDRAERIRFGICVLLAVVIAYSFYVRVRMYMLGVSLWNDEAWLAENIVNRSFSGLLTPPLDNLQTAPVLYLVAVKALTMAFGASEAVLRVFSLICFCGTLLCMGVLLRRGFRAQMPLVLFCLAVTSTFYYFLRYSNELKPYMGDACFALLVLCVYHSRTEPGGLLAGTGRTVKGAVFCGALYGAICLFSTPAAFFVCGVFFLELLLALRRHDGWRLRGTLLGGAVFLVIFALNYVLWLKPIAVDEAMLGFWVQMKFDFRFFLPDVPGHDLALLGALVEPLGSVKIMVLALAAAGFVVSLLRRHRVTWAVAFAGFFLLVASALSKYPVQDRLWMFFYALVFLYAFYFLSQIRISFGGSGDRAAARSRYATAAAVLLLSAALLAPNAAFADYGRGTEWTLLPGNQANPLIAYLQENAHDGEMVYSYHAANSILKYKNGYDTNRIGDAQSDNILWGTRDYDADIASLDAAGSGYVLFYHSYVPFSADAETIYVLNELNAHGYLDRVMDVYHTPLYWYSRDLAHLKTGASFEIYDLTATPGQISGVLRVTNTGSTILEPGGGEYPGGIYAVLKRVDDTGGGMTGGMTGGLAGGLAGDAGEWIIGKLEQPLAPGETSEFWIEAKEPGAGSYQIDLRSDGRYDFEEIGMTPFRLTTE